VTSARANGTTRQWQHIRRIVIARDGRHCKLCRRGPLFGPTLHVGHIVAIIDGGTDRLDNLRIECQPCSNAGGARIASRRRQPTTPREPRLNYHGTAWRTPDD
jgi:5-methylcytosine-specific restriction endonuclease McrA